MKRVCMIVEPDSITKPKLVSGSIDFAQLHDYITDMVLHGDSLVGLDTLFTANWPEAESSRVLFKRNQGVNNRARASSAGWR
ncbi:hypothetical protein NUU61_001560 [Penicillium alfredii]|uniref:Uncharacterized protein n=1 Tax=Penicillium alfredii TaxID=1506179 RepID=A0A9W9KMR6_9EURO|nr:uncharacterized protein NUU61_001560 [Penicillium alfredii]KAJ5111930.1 hypothetical protein NUU61_001560 [Penicillium alfredii]